MRSVQRAVGIMQALLQAAPRGLRVTELSRELGLHKTTVVRLLRTLCELHLLRRDDRTDCYVWEPLTWVAMMNSLRTLTAPMDGVGTVLEELANAADATVILSCPTPNGRQMGLSTYARPDRGMSLDPAAWRLSPMHCSAAGKAYLAAKPFEELEAWTRSGLPPATRRSITLPEILRGELARARERGFATALGECVLEAAEVGVPVRDDKGNAVAGLQVCAPPEAASDGSIQSWVGRLQQAAGRLTAVLYAVGPGDGYRTRGPLGVSGKDGSSAAPTSPPRRRPYRTI